MSAPIGSPVLDQDQVEGPTLTHAVDAETDMEVMKLVPKQFCIEDEQSANWLVRRVIAAREYGQRVKAFAEQELRRSVREEQTLMFLYGRQLQTWAKAQIEQNGRRRKSVCLPSGTLSFKTVNASLQIDDEAKVICWAKRNCPAAVIVVEKLSRSILTDHFKESGEVPDTGAHVEGPRESFSIR